MIRLAEDDRLSFPAFEDEFLQTKIKANFLAYGSRYPFLSSWYQQNEDKKLTALIQRLEDNLFITAGENADLSELKDFIYAIGFSSVQAKSEILTALGLDFKEYQVLCFEGSGEASLPDYPDIKRAYSVLYGEENENINPCDFEGFYVDLSHKIRKSCAAAIVDDGAVCIASHLTEDSAVISGVAVQSGSRRGGLGSDILKRMAFSLSGRKIFVAADISVVPFYLKNGFKKTYKTAIYETKDN